MVASSNLGIVFGLERRPVRALFDIEDFFRKPNGVNELRNRPHPSTVHASARLPYRTLTLPSGQAGGKAVKFRATGATASGLREEFG
jgi:hypothetical protein